MSATLSAREICNRALRRIGAFPITDTAPDGEDLREAMFHLDMILAELAGTYELMFLVPTTPATLTLVAGTQSYDLSSVMGTEYPDDGIQFPLLAWREDTDGNRYDVEIVSRQTFYEHEDSDQEGDPCEIWIDRLSSPTLYTWPTLPSDASDTWYIKLVTQRFAPNVAPKGVSGAVSASTTIHEFRVAWNRFLSYRLAADIGSGPVRFLPQVRIDYFHDQADQAITLLDARENREHDREPPIAEPWGGY